MNTNKFPAIKTSLFLKIKKQKQKHESPGYKPYPTQTSMKHIHIEQGIRGNFAFFPLGPESQVPALHCNSSWELPVLTPSSPCTNLRLITQEVLREDL